MIQSGFIAAIDLGTSKIKGVVGRKNENGIISIMAHESVSSENCIRRGVIHNVEETGAKVRRVIDFLEKRIEKKIGRVYVSLSGQSLYSINIREVNTVSPSGIVNEEIVRQLKAGAEKFKPDFRRKYAIADVEYFTDDKPEKNPIGVTCSRIEADYKVIVGRPNLYTNIQKAVEEKGQIQVADIIVGPLATAAIALTDEEKELGCALIDFGGGTTSLSIYKDDVLRYMVIIPFGGKNITKDIGALNFAETEAEQYKIKFGKAKDNQETSLFSSPFSSKPDINLEELNKVIIMRLDEITANIKEQIIQSGYNNQLGAGAIITGGASQLKNIDQYLENKLEMKVRKANTKKAVVNNASEITNDPAFTEVLGILALADGDCEQAFIEPVEYEETFEDTKTENKKGKKTFNDLRNIVKSNQEKEEKKHEKQKGNSLGQKMGNFFTTLFSDDENEE